MYTFMFCLIDKSEFKRLKTNGFEVKVYEKYVYLK